MLRADNLAKYYGAELIFEKVSFVVNEGIKTGLVGKNGTGKTTLLKILAGLEQPDGGSVSRSHGAVVGYLPQTMEEWGDRSVREVIEASQADIASAGSQLASLEARLSQPGLASGEMEKLLSDYGDARARFEAAGGYEVEHRAESVLHGLALGDVDMGRLVRTLSGGQQIKLALARLLLSGPSILLLDEPTNNLDLPSLLWLESYLNSYQGGVLVVSHDRRFLDRVVTQVIELDERTRTSAIYAGNFTAYSEQKRVEREKWEASYKDQQEWIERVEADIRQTKEQSRKTERETTNDYIRGRSKKVAKKAKSREKKLGRLLEGEGRIEEPPNSWSMKLDLDGSLPQAASVASLRGVTWSYGEKRVLTGVELDVRGRDRVAILGKNGSGKSTLLKIVAGEIDPQAGTALVGGGLHMGYFSQDHAGLRLDRTVLEEFRHDLTMYEYEARRQLSYFLFFGDDVHKQVRDLSLGERSKLLLAKMVVSGARFLVLDEPTNHMDYRSLEVIESALAAFEGAILLVSHDRTFVDALRIDRIYSLEGGRLTFHPGGYGEYEAAELASVERRAAMPSST